VILLLVAGQAGSHCVKSSVEDLLSEIQGRDASLARRVAILEDCMSAVCIPDPDKAGVFVADFTDTMNEALEKFAAAGMQRIDSHFDLHGYI
jgi:nicotinamidase-related amidase